MSSKKRHSRGRKPASYALEPLFKGVKEALMHDLDVDVSYSSDIRSREPIHLDFDKRLIWAGDNSFEKLSADSFTEFVDNQRNFLLPEPLSERGNRVLQLAREICTDILGEFSYDTWFDSCSFGKRAAVGLPQRVSYLDTRFERLSGTKTQWAAFNHCLARDTHLLRAMRKRSAGRTIVDAITATAVPKSFKAARIIAPDTILGGFLSRGLGDYIRKRLEKETHIDLAIQQERHRLWARQASVFGLYATIDMSKASDSFTWRHIECIVPENWHHALDCVRTRRCKVAGTDVDLRSYMLMGSGHTFPLQTLLFYCLAEATRRLLKSTGKASVYGDDIIVPIKIVQPLIAVFDELGFVVNSEKSFYDEPDALRPNHTFFRESCGGDYKGGVDVRPYMPECDLQARGKVSGNEFVAWCHKLVNGLLDHWDACELPTVLAFVLNEIESKKKAVCFVPAYEVDHAGIRHYLPPYLLIGRECSYVKYEQSYPTYFRLSYIRKKRGRGVDERPYLWYAYFLQQNSAEDPLTSLVNIIMSGAIKDASYSLPVSLQGESHKGREGTFRWTKRESQRY